MGGAEGCRRSSPFGGGLPGSPIRRGVCGGCFGERGDVVGRRVGGGGSFALAEAIDGDAGGRQIEDLTDDAGEGHIDRVVDKADRGDQQG